MQDCSAWPANLFCAVSGVLLFLMLLLFGVFVVIEILQMVRDHKDENRRREAARQKYRVER